MGADMAVRWNAAVLETNEWVKQLTLQRASGSRFHKALFALQQSDVLHHPGFDLATAIDYYRRILDHEYQVFVVEHDWAGAFEGSGEFDALPEKFDFRMPYPDCCFEFQLNGKRLCFLMRLVEGEDGPAYSAAAVVETSQGWMAAKLKEPIFADLADLAFKQVRAICIGLDCEVAEIETIRAPFKLNKAPERRGRPLIADYHIIKLARRSRPKPLPAQDEKEERRHVRLHFRRGHWRHFEHHKTWINWTLVGDPDLGFIDKHYRL